MKWEIMQEILKLLHRIAQFMNWVLRVSCYCPFHELGNSAAQFMNWTISHIRHNTCTKKRDNTVAKGIELKIKRSGVQLPLSVVCRSVCQILHLLFRATRHKGYVVQISKAGSVVSSYHNCPLPREVMVLFGHCITHSNENPTVSQSHPIQTHDFLVLHLSCIQSLCADGSVI